MCTATWLMHADGYALFFNRDELRTRKPALPPAVQERNGVKTIAPKDGDFGGSWIGVNEFGVTLGLLNYYPPITNHPSRITHLSRGLLLISLLDAPSSDEIARLLRQKKLADYLPFLLLIFAPKLVPTLLKWDGERITTESGPAPPITTSSFDSANVLRARKTAFAQLERLDAPTLTHFHQTGGDAYSVCMSRPDAQTVSFSRVTVTPQDIEFLYQPRESDGAFGEPVTVTLARGS